MSELRNILEQSVVRLFADHLDWDALTRIEETGWPEDLWAQVVELGIPLLFAEESHGGMGASWQDAYPVLRACGRYAVPLPVVESMLAHWLAARAGLELPDGMTGLVTAPLPETADAAVLQEAVVPWGRNASQLLAIAGTDVVLLDTAGLDVAKQDNIGRDARDRLSGSASVTARAPLMLPGDVLHCVGALARSAQIAGGGAAALDLAVQYTSEREQFGRPLSKFQAIQHHLADLGGIVASVDAMTMAACVALDQRGLDPAVRSGRFEVAAAKCRASEAVEKMTRLAHQVHGAIGFTYEYGLHFVTRRLWAWRAEFGGAAEWGSYLGRLACERGGAGVWPLITD